jgi:ubiquinone/menaquinone biosynthesis C-methylase UbiE/DNA-binding transcriptional ArsR family regulator
MEIVEALKALGDDSRLRLVHILNQGSFNVQELTGIVGLNQSTISHHLKILERAELLKSRKEGTWVYYSLANYFETPPTTPSVNPVPSVNQQLTTIILQALNRTVQLRSSLDHDKAGIEKALAVRRDRAKTYFDNVARSWNNIRQEAQGKADYLPNLKSIISDTGLLLELGCGSGALIKQLMPRKGKTIGIDYSEAMIKEATQSLADYKDNIDLRLGDLENLPVGDESVDSAVACMVFHHLANPEAVIIDSYRVLKPGGKFTVVDLTEHNNETMREIYADLWLGFNPQEFSKWLVSAGFNPPELSIIGEEKDVFILQTTKP